MDKSDNKYTIWYRIRRITISFYYDQCVSLQEMGFSQEQAESAIKRFGSVQQALDSLLAGVGK